MFRPDPPNVDSSTLNIYAVLIQKVSGSGADCEMVHVDSVAWHKRAPDRYFRYRGNVMGDSIDRDYTAAVFEFFFDTPIEVMDTFYVGFRSDYVSAYPF